MIHSRYKVRRCKFPGFIIYAILSNNDLLLYVCFLIEISAYKNMVEIHLALENRKTKVLWSTTLEDRKIYNAFLL